MQLEGLLEHWLQATKEEGPLPGLDRRQARKETQAALSAEIKSDHMRGNITSWSGLTQSDTFLYSSIHNAKRAENAGWTGKRRSSECELTGDGTFDVLQHPQLGITPLSCAVY